MSRRNYFQKANIRSYRGERFKNPYFPKNPKSLAIKLLPILLILTAIVAGVCYVVYGPLLKIEAISISGLTTIPNEEVEAYIWQELNHQGFRILPKDHRWFLPKNELQNKLMDEFDLAKAEISIEGDTVYFQMEEKILELVWRVDRSFYFVNLEGVITRELRQNERNTVMQRLNMELDAQNLTQDFATLQPTMPIIEDKTKQPVTIGDQILAADMAENILSFDLGLRQLAITPLIYETESLSDPWFNVVINEPYVVLFDGAEDASQQLIALSVALNEYTGNITEYIDVRFDNRAYIK